VKGFHLQEIWRGELRYLDFYENIHRIQAKVWSFFSLCCYRLLRDCKQDQKYKVVVKLSYHKEEGFTYINLFSSLLEFAMRSPFRPVFLWIPSKFGT
jgi:hypothetical protein